MFSFRAERTGDVYGVLFDIASGSVGVAIVASHLDDKLPKLIFSDRVTMRVTKHGGDANENLRRIREALFSAALLISQTGSEALKKHDTSAHISKLYVTCSSPWSYTVARNVHYENDESFKITHSILEDLIQSAEEEITSHLRNISVIHDEGFEIVERATVDIAVNEYPVSDPLSLQGRILDLSHVIGAIPKDILIAIHEAQDKLFPRTELRAHTYMLVMYCVLRDLFPTVGSICIIDVTSEATEFGIVEHNLLAENLFIPFGSSTFIRALAEETGKPISEAEMYLTDQNTLSTTDAELEETRAKYQESVTSAFSDLLSRRMIPSNIIITAQPKYQAFFKAMLEQTLQTVQGKNLRFIEVDPHIINEIASENEPDVYLALSARFFHKLHGCGEMNPH